MNYTIGKNRILVYSKKEFNPKHIFECGQVFLYKKNNDADYEVTSGDYFAHVYEEIDYYVIETNNTKYFVDYFDLKTDYLRIQQELVSRFNLGKYVLFGYGIRILNQNILETIVGFVLSQNNNIKRISSTMLKLCKDNGNETSYGYSFPSLDKLCMLSADYFKSIGAGYRANYLVCVLSALQKFGINQLQKLNSSDLESFLLSICGIGRKVADCILLFAFHRTDLFPVDTWVEKAYNYENFCLETNRSKIRKELQEKYKNLSGYAQQYIFYYFISNKEG